MTDKRALNDSSKILEYFNNLISSDSVILKDLLEKKKNYLNFKNIKEESVKNNTIKLDNTLEDIDLLNEQFNRLHNLFLNNKEKDYSLLLSVLELNFNPDRDLELLEEKFPIQISVRRDMVSELNSSIKEDKEIIEECTGDLYKVNKSLSVALNNQIKLIRLLSAAKKGNDDITREEVVDVLTGLSFSKEECKLAAKLILFPEDELIPYFKDVKFDILEKNSSFLLNDVDAFIAANSSYENVTQTNIDEVFANYDLDALFAKNSNDFKPEEIKDDKVFSEDKEEKEQEIFKEDSAPISFDELEEIKSNLVSTPMEPVIEEENSLSPVVFDDLNKSDDNSFDYNEFVTVDNMDDVKNKDNLEPINFNDITDMVNTNNNEVVSEPVVVPVIEPVNEVVNEPVSEPVSVEPIVVPVSEPSLVNPLENKTTLDKDGEKVIMDAFIEMGKNKDDIKLVDLKDKFDKDIFSALVDNIKDMDIDPVNVPLLAYKYGINNYLENIKSLNEYNYQLDSMEMQKFSTALYVTSNENVKKNLKTLSQYNISLKKPNGKLELKVLALDPKVLIDNIDIFITVGEYESLINNIDVLTKNCDGVCERILFCDVNSIPYTDEKNGRIVYKPYIYEQQLLNKLVEKELDLNNITTVEYNNNCLRSIISGDMIKELDNYYNSNDFLVNDNVNNKEKYDFILGRIKNYMECSPMYYMYNGYIFSYNNIARNLAYLINNDKGYSENDLILASLLYNSHYDVDDMNNIKDSLFN